MEGNQPLLHVGSLPHFRGAAEQHAHSSVPHLLEKRGFAAVVVEVLDESDLVGDNSARDELCAHVVIDREPFASGLRRGEVAEDELRSFRLSRVELV